MNNTFKKFYTTETTIIKNEIKNLFEGKYPRSLYEPCSYAFQGNGKYLRSFLVLLAAKATGGSSENVHNAAIAVELIHNFTLIHDDIMDHSEKRRGQKTLHKKYGLNTAILAGDALFVLAYESILKDCSVENSKEILTLFTKTGIRICQGQSLDMAFETRMDISSAEYLDMAYQKTAIATETWCFIGASLVKSPEKYKSAIAEYGKNLGLAFQIQDDYLDIAGDESVFGKPIGKDLLEGKKTYVFLRALEKATGKDRSMLLKITGSNKISKDEISTYKKIYEKLGVLEDTRVKIKTYTSKAIESLSILPDNEGRQLLEYLAKFLLTRER